MHRAGTARLSSLPAIVTLLSLLATPLLAQRVQFPTPAQPVQYGTPYPTTPTYATPAVPPGAVSPYAVTPAAPAPSTFAPYPATPYAPAAVGPPPPFDPYAVGGVAPAPPPVPYSAPPPGAIPYTSPVPPPPPAATFAQPGPGIQPSPNPFQYQPAPYDIQPAGENYWAKTQRLLQELSFEYTYLYGNGSNSNDFGYSRAEISATFAFPMFGNIDTPLLVTPGFATDWLQGPSSNAPGNPDLPPRLYDAYLDFAWFPHCYEWLRGEFGFRTGIYSDFDNVNSDSLRLMGRAAADVGISPDMDIVFGVAYLDRVDVKILPVVGLYYRPTPDWDLYLVFPNPKARKFLADVGTTKWYGYAAGEYGGGSWTVARQTTDDRIDYNDIRVIGGLEWETQSQIRGHVEIGYVFDREIVFVSGDPPNFQPNDTFMLRAGVDF